MSPPSAVALDLDGVLWLGPEPIAGAAEAVAALRAAGIQVWFVTNNAGPVVADQEAKLASFGVPAEGAVITSPMASAQLLTAGERVLVAGGPGVAEAIASVGAIPVSYEAADGGEAVDAVLVGMHRTFDWDDLRIASTAIRDRGARFIAANVDPTFPEASGQVPGNGAIVAAIQVASGATPVIAGKPYEPMARLVRDRCGPDGMVVGDRDDTDGALARACGWRFGLVLSGVTTASEVPLLEHTPDVVAADLAGLVSQLLSLRGITEPT